MKGVRQNSYGSTPVRAIKLAAKEDDSNDSSNHKLVDSLVVVHVSEFQPGHCRLLLLHVVTMAMCTAMVLSILCFVEMVLVVCHNI